MQWIGLVKTNHFIKWLQLPPKATLKKGNDLVEVDVKELKLGDIVVVRPGSKIPEDRARSDGTGFVNQAPITGEFRSWKNTDW